MATYEVEHNISSTGSEQQARRPRRPDLSTFFHTLEQADIQPSPDRPHNNPHAIPEPTDVSNAYRMLANVFLAMQNDQGSGTNSHADDGHGGLLEMMISSLLEDSENPPRMLAGVPESFFDGLDRVPKKALKQTDDCPICGNPFLDDEYPLVVRLPCHKDHMFDLECIQPWLKLHTTCPLDRKDLIKKNEPPAPKEEEEEEEEEDGEYDDMYA